MQTRAQHKKHFHTLINIGLVAFLILAATIGMRSLTYTGDFSISNVGSDKPVYEKVMVCAIGKCIFI